VGQKKVIIFILFLKFDIDLGARGTSALGCVTASAALAPKRRRGSDGHGHRLLGPTSVITGEARDMEPQGPGVRAAGGPTELQGI
jgi:hypothetical protein